MGIVCGVGLYEKGKYKCYKDGKVTIAYSIWSAMINRCYKKGRLDNGRYLDRDITVCDDWLIFQNFAEWFYDHYKDGFVLEKDLTCPGSKEYSPETCRFIPQQLNKLMTFRQKCRGSEPLGVHYDKNKCKYWACLSKYGKGIVGLGYYTSEEGAFAAYKEAKEEYIKELANYYYINGDIGEDTYQSLLCWEIVPYPE